MQQQESDRLELGSVVEDSFSNDALRAGLEIEFSNPEVRSSKLKDLRFLMYSVALGFAAGLLLIPKRKNEELSKSPSLPA